MQENAYGFVRRFEFAAAAVDARRPATVLDLGCGTGAYLLAPLARRYPDVAFTGVDSDAASIAEAGRELALPNVRLYATAEWPGTERFDLVIASEVIEHVESPPDFLVQAAGYLNEGGRLLLTLPNGYGSAEWASLLEALLRLSGIFPALRAVKRLFVPASPATGIARDSHAVSPHINFFSYRAIHDLLRDAGLTVRVFRPRAFLCGFGWDILIRGERLAAWNQRVTDRLPPSLAGDWMFVLERTAPAQTQPYRRGLYARLHRWTNEKMVRAA
jgi:SAM-dependent methyltransferase